MTRRYSHLLILFVLFVFGGSATVPAQILQARREMPKIWFVARVVDISPFTIEYLDDWYHYQSQRELREYDFVTDVEPHGAGEDIGRFKLGDLISGEFCNEFTSGGCPERAVKILNPASPDDCLGITPNVAINLKKLGGGGRSKWSKKGLLIDYKPREIGLVDRIKIYRDGRIALHSYSGETSGKLTEPEMTELERYFFSTHTDEANGIDATGLGSSLLTTYGRRRFLKFDQHSDVARSFTNRIDRLAERLLEDAQYRITYRWRFQVKDWTYGDVLPIDEAAKPGYEFIAKNRDRLAAIKAPEAFYEEAKERQGEIDKFMYRFKGKLYRFTFATCTDRATGSWGCYFASETGKGDSTRKVVAPFDEWPASLGISLRNIPDDAVDTAGKLFGDGVAIPKDDFIRHRKFYSQILGSEGQFQEGDFVYWGVRLWFK